MTNDADAAAPGAEAVFSLRVVSGRPTDEELAAVTAVLRDAAAEQGSAPEPLVVGDGRHWQRADGFLRGPLGPGRGNWRSF